MKSYVLVLKTVLLNNFRAVRTRYVRINDKKLNAKNKLSNATNAALALLGIAVIIVLMSIMTHALAFLSALEGLHVKLLSTMLTCVQITVLILGFSGVTSNMFFSKDNEFLSSLPVRPEAVFSAKLTVVYLNDLIVGSVFLIPLLVSYVVGVIQGGVTLPMYFYFMIPIAMLTIPVVPLAIISVLSFPMVKIVSYFKNKAIVTLVLSVVMFLGFFAIYMVFVKNIDKFVGSGAAKVLPKALADMIIAIDNVVFYNRFFALALTGTRFFGNVLIYLAVVCLSVGVVTGLAWTEVGGDILYIESILTPGKGGLTMTGNLGDVMKESATIAFEWVKAHCTELGIDPEKFEKYDLNIHVPEGAIPKDGPSAGITMVTSIVSTYTGRKVRDRIAMTGETTLRGRVTPVGGIKEKILAAKRAGITTLLLSEENRKDIEEIKPDYIKGLTFHYVRTNDDVLQLALEPQAQQ